MINKMNVKEILLDYLRKNGYDGLARPSIECGCGIEDIDDFIPCDGDIENCEPAYKIQGGTCKKVNCGNSRTYCYCFSTEK